MNDTQLNVRPQAVSEVQAAEMRGKACGPSSRKGRDPQRLRVSSLRRRAHIPEGVA